MEVRSVEAIVRALNGADVRYLIVGGLAVNVHGYERLTRDIDLVIGLERENIIRGLRTLIGIGFQTSIPITPEDFADSTQREEWSKDKNMIVLRLWSDTHRRTPIDVFVREPFDFDAEFAAARWVEVTGGVKAPVVRYKTLVAMKQQAGRDSDLLDIKNLSKLDPYR